MMSSDNINFTEYRCKTPRFNYGECQEDDYNFDPVD